MELLKHFMFLYMIRDTICFCGSDPSGIKVTTKKAKSIIVAWDTTKTNCGYTITGYRVYFNSLSLFKTYKSKNVSGATTDNIEVFPIYSGFFYNIFVKSLTAHGVVSNPTSINYTHPHSKPGAAPINIHASTKGVTSLTINWDALDIFHKNGDVKGYKVFYRGPGLVGTKSANVIGEANCQFTVSGLRPKSTYQFILQAINDVGSSIYSGLIPIATLPLPTTSTTTTTTTTTPKTIPTITTTTTTTTSTPIPTTLTITTKTTTVTTQTKTTTTLQTTASTSKTESTTQRVSRFKRPNNFSSHSISKTTTLPRVTNTVVTLLKHDKLNSGQIAGIVICCILTLCMLIVLYMLWSPERRRKWIKIRRIQPLERQP